MSIEGCNAWGDVDFAVAHFGGMSFVSLCYFVIFKLFIGQRAAEMQLQHQELQRELQIYTEENNCANVRYIKQLSFCTHIKCIYKYILVSYIMILLNC